MAGFFRIRGGIMDRFPLKLGAVLVSLTLAGPAAAALTVPFVDGRTGTIESLNRVIDGRASALVRWTDSLGNVRRSAVALRPIAAQGGALATRILGGRLVASASIALLLAEAMRGSLTNLWPEVQVENGVAIRPSTMPAWQLCESNLLSVADADGAKHASYAFLPCYSWASAPTRLVLRLPPAYPWNPDPTWLNEYDIGLDRVRDTWYVEASNPGVSVRGMREIIRPQSEKQLEMPVVSTPLTPAELTQGLMTPEVIGPLAINDSLPAELWEPLRAEELEQDPDTTQPGEGETELPPDATMSDVDRSIIDVRTWFTPDSWGWLPRSCEFPGPITPIDRWPQLTVDFSQYEHDFCPLIGTFVVPASDLTAILIFLSIVLRVRTGGG
ncbi:hypothetical protein ACLH0G_03775 [Aeromonas rivipollensis]|uniref:hypothetical protein n=1 Tax=Aeromonas rivipollensis TaxID=948519 RepID=UPI003D07A492